MDVETLKKQFSLALFLVPGNAFKAACVVFPDDLNMACIKAVEWNNDPEVLAEIERLKNIEDKALKDEEENLSLVPSKNEALELAWNLANNRLVEPRDRVNALKLFNEVAGYMPDKTINKNVVTEVKTNRVMVIKDFGDNEAWEKRAIDQQRELVNGN